jgi:hypothetical protein
MRSPASHTVTNLRPLAETLAVFDASEVKQGVWPQPLKIGDVFNPRFSAAVDLPTLEEIPSMHTSDRQPHW